MLKRWRSIFAWLLFTLVVVVLLGALAAASSFQDCYRGAKQDDSKIAAGSSSVGNRCRRKRGPNG